MSLNGDWDFGAGEQPRFDRRIRVPFAPQAALSGIGESDPGDVLWYRTGFPAPSCARLLLHFGAVDHRAQVVLNGVEVARHEGGHTPFTADLTGVAVAEWNELVVRVEDPAGDATLPRGKQSWKADSETIFYTPTSGIWQTVWLEPLPEAHLVSLRVQPDLAGGTVEVDVQLAAGAEDHAVLAVATLRGREEGRRHGPGGRFRLELGRVEAWSPEEPNLYDLELTVLDPSGRPTDRVTSYFGLRSVEAREGRFWLNGRPYVQRLVLDQGYFPGGLLTAPSDADLRRDIELARSLGFNGARKHQKLEDPRWLSWADRLGFLVWSEMPAFHLHSAEGERLLLAEWEEAVSRDRDHPSIVAWVPMNESFGLEACDDRQKASLLDRLYRLTHRLDGTRPVVSNDGWQHAVTDLCTLHDYGGPGELAVRYRDLAGALAPGGRPSPAYLPGHRHRGEPLIVSEFGGVRLAGQGGWAYGEAEDPAALLRTYRAMVEALMAPGPVEGFCYTQLTDVEQERNGLLTFDRRPKVEAHLLRAVTGIAKARPGEASEAEPVMS